MATIAEPGQSPPGAAARDDRITPSAWAWRAQSQPRCSDASATAASREVNISLFSMGLWMNASDLTIGLMTGYSPQSESRTGRINPMWSSYRCADARWIYFVMLQSDRYWPDFCLALGKPDWRGDPRFKDSTARAQNCAALTGEIDRAVAARSCDDWAPIFDRHNLIWAPVRTDAEVLRRSAGGSDRRFRRRGPSEYSRMPRRQRPRRVWRRQHNSPSCGARTRTAYRGSRARNGADVGRESPAQSLRHPGMIYSPCNGPNPLLAGDFELLEQSNTIVKLHFPEKV